MSNYKLIFGNVSGPSTDVIMESADCSKPIAIYDRGRWGKQECFFVRIGWLNWCPSALSDTFSPVIDNQPVEYEKDLTALVVAVPSEQEIREAYSKALSSYVKKYLI